MRERIKQIIDNEGMSQSQFADFVEVNRPTLSHILAGRNNPSMDVVMKIHQKFPKINILWLLDGVGSYEGDAVADYPAGTLVEDSYADKDSETSMRGDESEGLAFGYGAKQSDSRFYQGELFGDSPVLPSGKPRENPVFMPESAGDAKKRKEMPFQTAQNSLFGSDIQRVAGPKIVQRKIVEIKIFYDDGTYETFRP